MSRRSLVFLRYFRPDKSGIFRFFSVTFLGQ